MYTSRPPETQVPTSQLAPPARISNPSGFDPPSTLQSTELPVDELRRIRHTSGILQMRQRDRQSPHTNQVSRVAEHLNLITREPRDAAVELLIQGVAEQHHRADARLDILRQPFNRARSEGRPLTSPDISIQFPTIIRRAYLYPPAAILACGHLFAISVIKRAISLIELSLVPSGRKLSAKDAGYSTPWSAKLPP